MNLLQKNPHFTPSRLNSLYSDYSSSRDLNPEGFTANINAWASLFNDILEARRSFVIDIPSLESELSHPIYGKPHVRIAAEELARSNVLVSYENFMNPSWLSFLRGKPDKYVNVDRIAKVGKTLKKTLYSRVTLKHELEMGEGEVDVLVRGLARDKNCHVDGDYVSLKGPITESDKQLISLHTVTLQTELMAAGQAKRIAEINSELAALDAVKNRERARHLLRVRRTVARSHDHVTNAHVELVALEARVQDAKINSDMFCVLQDCNALLARNNVDMDELRDLKDAISENVANVSEVSEELGRFGIADEDVEDELRMLEEEEKKSEKSEKKNKKSENEKSEDEKKNTKDQETEESKELDPKTKELEPKTKEPQPKTKVPQPKTKDPQPKTKEPESTQIESNNDVETLADNLHGLDLDSKGSEAFPKVPSKKPREPELELA